jgi:hypothetical protein
MNMKQLYYVVIVTILAFLATAATTGVQSAGVGVSASHSQDGAYCDGLFLGRYDHTRHLPHHVSSGRWNTASGRRSFLAGYEQGYSENSLN